MDGGLPPARAPAAVAAWMPSVGIRQPRLTPLPDRLEEIARRGAGIVWARRLQRA